MAAVKTRVFKSGNSRAVRIPKAIDLPVREVYIEKRGKEIVIRKKPKTIGDVLDQLGSTPDFVEGGRDQGTQRDRKWWHEECRATCSTLTFALS